MNTFLVIVAVIVAVVVLLWYLDWAFKSRPSQETTPLAEPRAETLPLEITSTSHVLIEWWNGRVFFPRYALTDDELKPLAEAVKMVMRTLRDDPYPIGKAQNLFSPLHDYQRPVEKYLKYHPAVEGLDVSFKIEDERVVVDGKIALDFKDSRVLRSLLGKRPAYALILRYISDITCAGDVAYLKPLGYGKGGEAFPEPWKAVSLEIANWWHFDEFTMSGHAATTLERMGFNLNRDSEVDRLIVPIYYHPRATIEYDPETRGEYGHGESASRIYINRWLNPRGQDPSGFDAPSWSGCHYDHSAAYFPTSDRCLFVDADGSITLGPPKEGAGFSTKEVDGYAISLGSGWAIPADYSKGAPSSHTGIEPYVFHRLLLKHFLYESLQWMESLPQPTYARRAVYRPGEEVRFLDSKLRTLCELVPCHCGNRRKTVGQCEGDCHHGTFCEHCVVKGKFCSHKCAERTEAKQAGARAIEGLVKL